MTDLWKSNHGNEILDKYKILTPDIEANERDINANQWIIDQF